MEASVLTGPDSVRALESRLQEAHLGVTSRERLGFRIPGNARQGCRRGEGGAVAPEGGVSGVGVAWVGLCRGSPVKKSVAGRGL